jgi:hypothetical protein
VDDDECIYCARLSEFLGIDILMEIEEKLRSSLSEEERLVMDLLHEPLIVAPRFCNITSGDKITCSEVAKVSLIFIFTHIVFNCKLFERIK